MLRKTPAGDHPETFQLVIIREAPGGDVPEAGGPAQCHGNAAAGLTVHFLEGIQGTTLYECTAYHEDSCGRVARP